MQRSKVRQIFGRCAVAFIAAISLATPAHSASGPTIPNQVKVDATKLLKDKIGRPYGGYYFPFINYSPTIIIGKPCPRVTTWNLVEETIGPFKVGYLDSACAVQNAIDDFAEMSYAELVYTPADAVNQLSRSLISDTLLSKAYTPFLLRSLATEDQVRQNAVHVCNQPMVRLLDVTPKAQADLRGKGRILFLQYIVVAKDLKPFECKAYNVANSKVLLAWGATSAQLNSEHAVARIEVRMTYNPKFQRWQYASAKRLSDTQMMKGAQLKSLYTHASYQP